MPENRPSRDHPWGQITAVAVILPLLIVGLYWAGSVLAGHAGWSADVQWQWERHIPFVPAMAGPYLSLYPLLVLGIAASRSRGELWRLAAALLLGTLISATVFVLLPTGANWPDRETTGLMRDVYEHLDRLGGGNAAIPSLHIVLTGILWAHFAAITRGPWRWLVRCWFVLLAASVLLTHQHHVMDVLAGAAVALVCVLLLGIGGQRAQIRFWRRLRSRRNSRNAPGPNSHSAVTVPNDMPVQVPRSQ